MRTREAGVIELGPPRKKFGCRWDWAAGIAALNKRFRVPRASARSDAYRASVTSTPLVGAIAKNVVSNR